MEIVEVETEAHQELPNIGDTGGPSSHWYPKGASYHILKM